MKEIVFLASGGGGNLAFLELAMRRYLPDSFRVSALVADRRCGAIEIANKLKISCSVIKYKKDQPEALRALLEQGEPDYIVTNIHKILDAMTVERFSGRMINLHYSLLPLFGGSIGTEPVRAALENGCKFVGTTAHLVTEAVDAGLILSQSVVPVVFNEPFDNLMERVFKSGAINLFRAFMALGEPALAQGPISDDCQFSPNFKIDQKWFGDDFWQELKEVTRA